MCIRDRRPPILAALLPALQQRASAKLCGVVQGMELSNFRRQRHLHSAGRPSRWASAQILVILYFADNDSLMAGSVGQSGQSPANFVPNGKQYCLQYHHAASTLILPPFHIEFNRIIMHASWNRFTIAYSHKQKVSLASRGLRPRSPSRGFASAPRWGHCRQTPIFLTSHFKWPSPGYEWQWLWYRKLETNTYAKQTTFIQLSLSLSICCHENIDNYRIRTELTQLKNINTRTDLPSGMKWLTP